LVLLTIQYLLFYSAGFIVPYLVASDIAKSILVPRPLFCLRSSEAFSAITFASVLVGIISLYTFLVFLKPLAAFFSSYPFSGAGMGIIMCWVCVGVVLLVLTVHAFKDAAFIARTYPLLHKGMDQAEVRKLWRDPIKKEMDIDATGDDFEIWYYPLEGRVEFGVDDKVRDWRLPDTEKQRSSNKSYMMCDESADDGY
jgi:hypothetical protein